MPFDLEMLTRLLDAFSKGYLASPPPEEAEKEHKKLARIIERDFLPSSLKGKVKGKLFADNPGGLMHISGGEGKRGSFVIQDNSGFLGMKSRTTQGTGEIVINGEIINFKSKSKEFYLFTRAVVHEYGHLIFGTCFDALPHIGGENYIFNGIQVPYFRGLELDEGFAFWFEDTVSNSQRISIGRVTSYNHYRQRGADPQEIARFYRRLRNQSNREGPRKVIAKLEETISQSI